LKTGIERALESLLLAANFAEIKAWNLKISCFDRVSRDPMLTLSPPQMHLNVSQPDR
jgi:hypothetical protein